MLHWLKTKLHEKKVRDRAHKHLVTASGPPLHRLAIRAAQSALEDDLVREELGRVRPDEQRAFMMTYECLIMWAIRRGLFSAGLPEGVQADVLAAIRDHFAEHAWYTPGEFEKLWDKTEEWMSEFAKPSKDGNLWLAAALVQIPHAAGVRLGFSPGLTFGIHLINALVGITKMGKFAGEQELAGNVPQPASALEVSREASAILIVRAVH